MIMHWQQWYFVAVLASALLGAGVTTARDPGAGVISALFTLLGICVLYSAGFFTGGV